MFSIKKVLFVTLAASAFSAASFAVDKDIEAKYNKACSVCHAAGVAGAPKVGDAEAWKPRLAKGMDTIVASVTNGLNAMPPKGMCTDCSEEDYTALITYMSTPK